MKAMPCYRWIAGGLAILPAISLAASPAIASNAMHTDKVVIENRTPRPGFGSGGIHVLVRIGGVTTSGEKRDYYITYFGEEQPLPEIGATCDIIYRDQSEGGAVFELQSPALPDIVRYVRRFSCVGPDMVYDEQEFLARAHEASRRRR